MRFIQVGVGGFGANWVKVLKANPAAKVVAMVDVNAKALEAACAAGEYPASICYPSLPEALRAVEADALVSCTPPALHKADVTTALKAGLHVISEKPMADSLASCKAMLRTARQTGRLYAVSQNYRYRDTMWAMAQLVRSGKLGAVGQVTLDFFKGVDFGGGFRHSMDYPLIVDMSIHHFDLIRFITGLDAVSVRASAWNPPWSNYAGECSSSAVFTMNNGATVLYNGSWCSKGSFCDWNGNWQIECEKGTLTYRNGEIRLLQAPAGYTVKRERVVKPRPLARQAQHFVLDDFMKAVRRGTRPRTDVYDNIRSVAMVFATVRAMESDRTVPVLDREVRTMIDGLS